MKKFLALCLLLTGLVGSSLTLFVEPAEAVDRNAASCSMADVSAAIISANNSGDTVLVPAGTCHWTGSPTSHGGALTAWCNLGAAYDNTFCKNGSTIRGDTKNVTIQGAGIGQTIIIDDSAPTPFGDTDRLMISWPMNSSGVNRITGIEFRSGTHGCGANVGGIIMRGDTTTLRIDHNKFVVTNCPGLTFHGYVRGVMDHNFFALGAGQIAYTVSNQSWGNICFTDCVGDNSWAQPDTVGTSDVLYVEDNICQNLTESNYTTFLQDGFAGGRVVIRHNNLRACNAGMHGADSGPRGGRQQEFYKNIVSGNTGCVNTTNADGDNVTNASGCGKWNPGVATAPFSSRSGVAIAFANEIRTDDNFSAWSGSDFRENPGGCSAFPAECNSTYADPLATLPGCDGTNRYDANVGQAPDLRSTPFCLDQVGAGYGDRMDSFAAGGPVNLDRGNTKTHAHQRLQPAYCWDNTRNGISIGCVSGSNWVILNVDIINNTVRPLKGDGVTSYCPGSDPRCTTTDPFTYPHPNVTGGVTPTASKFKGARGKHRMTGTVRAN